MNIALGGDHAGFEYKQQIIKLLTNQGHKVNDFGPFSDDSVDYPDYVHPASAAIVSNQYDMGVFICGSGNGVAMTANKHAGIRAALCWNSELAALARQHNNANVLCLPARFVPYAMAEDMVNTFLKVEFEGGRHEQRVDKIKC